MTALIYQVAWMRELRLIFGFSTAASAAVVAIFMGGLGAGSWLLGRRADRAAAPSRLLRPARAGGGGLGGHHARSWSSSSGRPTSRWAARCGWVSSAGTLARLLFSALVLCRADGAHGRHAAGGDARRGDRRGLGASVSRAALRLQHARSRRGDRALDVPPAGDVRHPADALGWPASSTRSSDWRPCGSRGRRRRSRSTAESSEDSRPAIPESRSAEKPQRRKTQKKKRRRREEETPRPDRRRSAAGVAGSRVSCSRRRRIVGFAFFLMELVWYRMLAPLLGGSTYTFGLILASRSRASDRARAVVLARGRGSGATLSGFAATCALEAAVPRRALRASETGWRFSPSLLRPIGAFGIRRLRRGLVAGRGPRRLPGGLRRGTAVSAADRAARAQGASASARTSGSRTPGTRSGGIVGSLAGGFGLLPLLSATGTWVFVTVLLLRARCPRAPRLPSRREGTRKRRRRSVEHPARVAAAAASRSFCC